jgi:hypothetical protein
MTSKETNGTPSPTVAEEHRRLVRKEITSREYVEIVKKDVNRRLGLEPSRFGRAGRRRAAAAS